VSSFLNLNLRFAGIAELTAWLATCPPPEWQPDGIRYHNTYIPNKAQWRGAASMRSMQQSYEQQTPPWDRGPHLYLATGTAFDGIWVMTPPWQPGIHAGPCNSHTFGVETVADWDRDQPTEAEKELLVGVCAALTAYAARPLDLAAHKDCMPNRTCPGRFGYAMKAELQTRLAATLHTVEFQPAYSADSPLLGPPGASEAQAAAYILGRPHGYTTYDITREILPAYWLHAGRAGIDPVVAVAQMLHETDMLRSPRAQRPQRNPAGIGATNDGAPGAFFATWRDHAIPAHIGRLLAYAVPRATTPEQERLIADALAVRGLPARAFGSVHVLRELGAAHNPANVGRPEAEWVGWASPGTDYGEKIAAIANAIRSS
jgi:hypothetical protein